MEAVEHVWQALHLVLRHAQRIIHINHLEMPKWLQLRGKIPSFAYQKTAVSHTCVPREPHYDRLRVGEVPRGEKILYAGTDPESYITQYTLVYEDHLKGALADVEGVAVKAVEHVGEPLHLALRHAQQTSFKCKMASFLWSSTILCVSENSSFTYMCS